MAIVTMVDAVSGGIALASEYNKVTANIRDLDTRLTAASAAIANGTTGNAALDARLGSGVGTGANVTTGSATSQLTSLRSRMTAVEAASITGTVRVFGARLASNQTIAGLADVTGCSVTFTTANVNTPVVVTGSFTSNTPDLNYIEGRINVDGTDRPELCIGGKNGATAGQTHSQTINVVLASAGSHTIKLRAVNTTSACSLDANSTGITVLVAGL
jgi:hypothetical protein